MRNKKCETTDNYYVYIPENEFNIAAGYYAVNDIVKLLREYCIIRRKIKVSGRAF